LQPGLACAGATRVYDIPTDTTWDAVLEVSVPLMALKPSSPAGLPVILSTYVAGPLCPRLEGWGDAGRSCAGDLTASARDAGHRYHYWHPAVLTNMAAKLHIISGDGWNRWSGLAGTSRSLLLIVSNPSDLQLPRRSLPIPDVIPFLYEGTVISQPAGYRDQHDPIHLGGRDRGGGPGR
jgi:hypothetical protein